MQALQICGLVGKNWERNGDFILSLKLKISVMKLNITNRMFQKDISRVWNPCYCKKVNRLLMMSHFASLRESSTDSSKKLNMLSLSTSQSGFFTGYDNFPVFYKIWIPRGSPVARVLAFHGLGEHIGRYNHLFSHFADNGILVRAFDYRGHGNTFKKRSGQKSNVLGHARISDLCEDMIILETVNKQDDEAGIPLFYFGSHNVTL